MLLFVFSLPTIVWGQRGWRCARHFSKKFEIETDQIAITRNDPLPTIKLHFLWLVSFVVAFEYCAFKNYQISRSFSLLRRWKICLEYRVINFYGRFFVVVVVWGKINVRFNDTTFLLKDIFRSTGKFSDLPTINDKTIFHLIYFGYCQVKGII